MRTLVWHYSPRHNDACKKRKLNCVLPDLSPHFRSMCLQLLTKESCRNVVSFYLHNVVSVSGTENNISSCGKNIFAKTKNEILLNLYISLSSFIKMHIMSLHLISFHLMIMIILKDFFLII